MVAGHPNGNRKFKVTIKGKPEVYRDCVGLDNRATKASDLEKINSPIFKPVATDKKKDKKEDTLVSTGSEFTLYLQYKIYKSYRGRYRK